MESDRFTFQEAAALLTAAQCHRETLEGVYSAIARNGGQEYARGALGREIQTLAGAADKLKSMIKEDRQCEEK